jgi:DNA-binding response OmpR family regulator
MTEGKATPRILVIDSSRTYAGMVKDMLTKHVAGARVEVATNIYELRRRIAKCSYDLVVADLSVACDGDEMATELENAHALVVVWSAVQSQKSSSYTELRKPMTLDEIASAVPALAQCAAG